MTDEALDREARDALAMSQEELLARFDAGTPAELWKRGSPGPCPLCGHMDPDATRCLHGVGDNRCIRQRDHDGPHVAIFTASAVAFRRVTTCVLGDRSGEDD